MQTKTAYTLTFGKEGNYIPHALYGWSRPEDGFTWSNGPAVGLSVPAAQLGKSLFIEIDAGPLAVPARPHGRRIILSVNGIEIGQARNTRRERIAWYVPDLDVDCGSLIVNFGLPDAERPDVKHDQRLLSLRMASLRVFGATQSSDSRPLQGATLPIPANPDVAKGFAQAITQKAPSELLKDFESLGSNCEFGFVQRLCGAEPLSLLRFSGTTGHILVSSIDEAFRDLGDPDSIDPVPDEADLKDWVIYERKYHLRYHTWVSVQDANVKQIKDRETKRLKFLRRKLLEDLAEGGKIFVYHERRHLDLSLVLPLFLALKRHGKARLLVVQPASSTHRPGTVQEVMPDLMFGYISRFSDAPNNIGPVLEEWLSICSAAFLIKQMTAV